MWGTQGESGSSPGWAQGQGTWVSRVWGEQGGREASPWHPHGDRAARRGAQPCASHRGFLLQTLCPGSSLIWASSIQTHFPFILAGPQEAADWQALIKVICIFLMLAVCEHKEDRCLCCSLGSASSSCPSPGWPHRLPLRHPPHHLQSSAGFCSYSAQFCPLKPHRWGHSNPGVLGDFNPCPALLQDTRDATGTHSCCAGGVVL